MTALTPKEQRRLNAILAINNARTICMDRYEEEGCFDRFSYFESLAEDHGVQSGPHLGEGFGRGRQAFAGFALFWNVHFVHAGS